MPEQWKPICKIKDIPLLGARLVQRGLAWQELPNVAIFRAADDQVFALLDTLPQQGGALSRGVVYGDKVVCPERCWSVDLATGCSDAPGVGSAKTFSVKLEDGKVYLDIEELSAPASRAEAALAGSFAVATRIAAAWPPTT
jgi:nitrite reductase (NADH) small subunit